MTFRGLAISRLWPLRFVISVGLSYLIAKVLLLQVFEYLIVRQPLRGLADWVQNLVAADADPVKFRDSLVMLATTFIYCVVNYIGQRYYVFRPRKQGTEYQKPQADRTDA